MAQCFQMRRTALITKNYLVQYAAVLRLKTGIKKTDCGGEVGIQKMN